MRSGHILRKHWWSLEPSLCKWVVFPRVPYLIYGETRLRTEKVGHGTLIIVYRIIDLSNFPFICDNCFSRITDTFKLISLERIMWELLLLRHMWEVLLLRHMLFHYIETTSNCFPLYQIIRHGTCFWSGVQFFCLSFTSTRQETRERVKR